jgi:histidine ammonia-lyase
VQGIEYRAPLRPAPVTAELCASVRKVVPRLAEDRVLAGEIEAVAAMLTTTPPFWRGKTAP